MFVYVYLSVVFLKSYIRDYDVKLATARRAILIEIN